MGAGKTKLVLMAFVVLGSVSVVAAQQSQDQASTPTAQSVTAPQSSQRVRLSSGDAQKLRVKGVNPAYPKKARAKRIQGQVLLRILISREGDVREVTVVSGDPLLASAAADTVKQWKYRPYLLGDQPFEVESIVPVNFKLSGN
jgi:periplasmic protein TonB